MPADRLLVRILARRDAATIHAICGIERGTAHARARRYSEDGVKWEAAERDGAGRKRAVRALADLAEAGLIEIIRARGKVSGTKLTDKGELNAAVLAAVPTLIEAWPWALLEAIRRRSGWVPVEHLLPTWARTFPGAASGQWEHAAKVHHVLMCVIPFAVRGAIAGGSTVRGQVRLRATDKVMARPETQPFNIEERQDYGALSGIYDREFRQQKAMLNSAVDDHNDVSPIPLAVAAASDEELAAWRMSADLAAQGE